jgi:predicted Zn-dependent peptidase
LKSASEAKASHVQLDCGVELAVQPLADRRTVCAELRFLTGFCDEPAGALGLNYILEETIARGTQRRSGRELSDAFDAIGVRWSSWAGREASGFHFTCLPEFFGQALELHAEYLRQPAFEADSVEVAVRLTLEELDHLEDDAQEYASKLFTRQVYGPVLGRHVLGQRETLQAITREDVISFWKEYYHAGRLQISVVGPVEPQQVAQGVQAMLAGWGTGQQAGRQRRAWRFEPRRSHHPKDLEQEHIAICFPGADLTNPRRFAQKVTMGVLSGGMSSRLFTQLREEQGLVYWVSAWTEHPRGIGTVCLGASTTPQRCHKTYQALLGEVDRLADDLEEAELGRAIAGLLARAETRGAVTRAWCSELADNLFHYGRVVPRQETLDAIKAVTLADVREYLAAFPRDSLSVLTLGPRELEAGE